MFCKVAQKIIVIINENNTDPIIVVTHIAHYIQNLMSHDDSSFISLGLSTDR
jgi:hypothetical protein